MDQRTDSEVVTACAERSHFITSRECSMCCAQEAAEVASELGEGDLLVCIMCTSVLTVAKRRSSPVPAAVWLTHPAERRRLVSAASDQMEQGRRLPLATMTAMVITRGPNDWRPLLFLCEGTVLVGHTRPTVELARQDVLSVRDQKQPMVLALETGTGTDVHAPGRHLGWFIRARLQVFGSWFSLPYTQGPFSTEAEAKHAGLEGMPGLRTRLGLGAPTFVQRLDSMPPGPPN